MSSSPSASKNPLELDITDIVNFIDGVDLDTLCDEFAELLGDDDDMQYRGIVEEIKNHFKVTLTDKGSINSLNL